MAENFCVYHLYTSHILVTDFCEILILGKTVLPLCEVGKEISAKGGQRMC